MRLSKTIAVVVLVGLAACGVNEENTLPIVGDVSVENGMLTFASENAYNDFLEQYTDADLKILSEAAYQPLSKRLAGATLAERSLSGIEDNEDSFLYTLLNEEGLVTIGSWVAKVDMVHELVAITSVNDAEATSALIAGDNDHSNILWFSTSDDVLGLLEEKQLGTMPFSAAQDRLAISVEDLWEDKQVDVQEESICSFGRSTTVSTRTKKTIIEEALCGDYQQDCLRWLADAKHTYQKAGIYFSLQSKIKYRGNVSCASNAPWAIRTDLTISVSWKYTKRVRFGKNKKRSGNHNNSDFNNELNHRAYEGSRSIKDWELNTTFTYRRKDDCSTNHNCPAGSGTIRTIVMPQIRG